MRSKFEPTLVSTLMVLITLPLLIALGVWQLHRAEEKRQLQATYDRQNALPPVALTQMRDTSLYRNVLIRGVFFTQHDVFLDNQVHLGRVGYHVISPLTLQNGVIVLVNRGWVPLGASRKTLPVIETPTGVVQLSGRVKPFPDVGYRLSSAEYANQRWPKVVQYVDNSLTAQWFDQKVSPFVVQLNADQAYGYVRRWKLITARSQRHTAYAIQWFAIALVLLVIYIKVSFRKE